VLTALDERGLLTAATSTAPARSSRRGTTTSSCRSPASRPSPRCARGLTDDDVVAAYLGDVEEHPHYCCLYEHPDDLGPVELAVFDRVFTAVARSGREVVTLGEIARRTAGAPPARS
jgi:hypothetical protein